MSYKLAVGAVDVDIINIRCEQLGAEWGTLVIQCDGKTCFVEDAIGNFHYEGVTLLEALNEAAEDLGI